MAAVDVVRARIDPDLKKEAGAVLASLGLTISDAIRLMLVRVAADRGLPFELRVPDGKAPAGPRDGRAGTAAIGLNGSPDASETRRPSPRSLGDLLPELGSRGDGRPVRGPGR